MPPHPEAGAPLQESSSRRLRRRVLSWLPGGQRARLRRLYERTTAPADRAAATLEVEGDVLVAHIANGPAVRFSADCRFDIERQFTDPEAAAELRRFMTAAAASPGVLFDVGANHGLFSLVYCLSDPGNSAVAFEPSPRLADAIRRLARLNHVDDRLQVVAKAVAEVSGTRELLLDQRGGYVQVAAFAGTTHGDWQNRSMPLITLDEALRTATPSLVKMDIEGYEHEAMRGAATLLQQIRPTVFLELHLNYLQARGIAPSTVIDHLTRHGYRLTDLSGRRRSASDIERSWASVLHLIGVPDQP